MNRGTSVKGLLACGLLLAGGCGTVPELLVEAAKASAMETLEKRIDAVIDGPLDEFLNQSLDLDNLDLPFNQDEENQSAPAEDLQ